MKIMLHNCLMTIKFYESHNNLFITFKLGNPGKYRNNIDPSESGEFFQLVQYSLKVATRGHKLRFNLGQN